MSLIVHVILPTGTRHERTFPDGTGADSILTQLDRVKHMFGFNGTVQKVDNTHPTQKPVTDFGDPKSGFVYDNPKTRVVILKSRPVEDAMGRPIDVEAVLDDKGVPIISKQLKGPQEEV